MGSVYVTTYEVIGTGIEIADEHYAAVDAARSAQWAFVEEIGAAGFRPDHDGGVRSIMFAGDLPTGWRKIGREGDKIGARPNKSTKAGKEALAAMANLAKAPRPTDLAAKLGYAPRDMALDSHRGTIYFATEMRLSFPGKRIFVRLPRFANDGFEPDETILRALPESEFMKAVEDHNHEARLRREAKAAA